MRWARCPDDDRLHLLRPAELPHAAGDHAQALCGQRVPADGLTTISGLSWALCITCVCGIPPEMSDPDPGDIAP
ncbi:MAG: hypothetical protein ACRDRS_22915 [Pseudonocardiaceae bacterium]